MFCRRRGFRKQQSVAYPPQAHAPGVCVAMHSSGTDRFTRPLLRGASMHRAFVRELRNRTG
jgi:hypothetical protein